MLGASFVTKAPPMPERTLDARLARLRGGSTARSDFIIADAKDGDMAFGVTAPGPAPTGPAGPSAWKPRSAHLDAIAAMVDAGQIDIMLCSLSSAEILHARSVFAGTAVTPAVRLNDTTDIWNARGSRYRDSASRPFASADIEAAAAVADLGLYSMTFSNDLERDLDNLERYRDFRLSLRGSGMRHFLEVFNPAFDIGIPADRIGHYINDMIIKALAGAPAQDAPLFLKLQFNGAAAMRELADYDPERLIVGILGGSAGTTRDTFELVSQAADAGARVALFGRKINLAESPLTLVRLMREVIEQRLSPADAVDEYHRCLADEGHAPQRALAQDRQVTEPALLA